MLCLGGLLLLAAAGCDGVDDVPKADPAVIQRAEQLRDRGLASPLALEIVTSLTTEIGPRLAGTEADHRAVAWGEALLKELNFDRVWLERVELPVWQRHRERAAIVAPYPQMLHVTAIGNSGSTEGVLAAPVVRFETLQQLEAVEPGELAGKIVYINTRMERTIDGSGYGQISAMRFQGGRMAKERGALALMIRSLGTHRDRFAHTGSSRPHDDPIPSVALSIPDAEQLDRIIDGGETVTVSLDIETSLTEEGHSWNVIGQLDGRELPEQLVLIGGHLDSWDLGTGAVDDGAGIAITAAAASLIAQLPERPRRSIRVVMFAAEEHGLIGARKYAEVHKDEIQNHIAASESDFGAGAVWALDSDSAALLNAAMPVLAPLGIARGEAATSGGPDIFPLMQQGVRVFRLRQDGTDYFDYHHTPNDTLDKVDPESLRQNVAAWAAVTYLAAELDW
ncbi:MAG: M20/M25/M40 family metallo-hydrolase [Gammaproteobacteria bacterium AqS3]|nr:M20/M25/M40 family metallo-hydrolase [Gammaproteobacteria bacterium AqS3]